MKKKDDVTTILVEDIDEEILKRMPEWFKILRRVYYRH